MANKYADRLPFSTRAKFVVNKPFKIGGRDYQRGEDFPHQRLALASRKLRTLYDARLLSMKDDEPETVQVVETPVEPAPATEGEFVYDPEIHMIEHENSEYWVADENYSYLRVRASVGKKLDMALDKVTISADDILAWAE